MTDIISVSPVDFGGEEVQAVSARDLYEFLGARSSNFLRWSVKYISKSEYAIEGEDYILSPLLDESIGWIDYTLSIDFAKRLAMMTKTPKGEEVRQYFLNVEKSFKKIIAAPQVPQTYMQALEAHIATLKQLETTGEKLLQAENKISLLSHSGKIYSATEIGKELGMRSANELNARLEEMGLQFKTNGTWVLRAWLADKGYTSMKQTLLENGKVVYNRMWTQAGREFILSKFSQPQ